MIDFVLDESIDEDQIPNNQSPFGQMLAAAAPEGGDTPSPRWKGAIHHGEEADPAVDLGARHDLPAPARPLREQGALDERLR